MERGHGRTETTGSTTTVVAVIRGDDLVLRPGLPRRVRAIVCTFDGVRVVRTIESFEVTFRYGLHWDVARVQSPLRLRYQPELTDDELATR